MMSLSIKPGTAGRKAGLPKASAKSRVNSLFGNGLRGGAVDGARGGFFPVKQKKKNPGQVLLVDPGKPLPAAAQGTSQALFKQGDHLIQGPAPFPQDDPEAAADHPHSEGFGLLGLGLPVPGKVGLENRTPEGFPP